MFKRILNATEQATFGILRSVCDEYGATVFVKIRVADILPIEQSGITREQFSFALKSHFDFIVARDEIPCFAIEFDGSSHTSEAQKQRDSIKNRLCEHFNLPIVRINSRYIIKRQGTMDILSWIVHVWFLQEAFDQAQERGHIAPDEGFTPSLMFFPDLNQRPLFLSRQVRSQIQSLYRKKAIVQASPSYLIGSDAAGNHRGFTWIQFTESKWVSARTAMRFQQMAFDHSELLEELLVFELWSKMRECLEGAKQAESAEQLSTKIKQYESYVSVHSYGGCGSQITERAINDMCRVSTKRT